MEKQISNEINNNEVAKQEKNYDSSTQRNPKSSKDARRRSKNRSRNRTNTRDNKPKTQMQPTNNARMYFINPELADQAAQFSFSNYLGQSQSPAFLGLGEIPTVLSLAINPSPGITKGDLTDGINIAGLRTYTRLSAGNAKTTNYAPQDISTLILAVGEVISMLEVAKRAMRVAYTYNQRNRALPLGIIAATGIDPQFIVEGQIAQMRLKLNYVINAFNQVPILANVSYFEKCSEIYANYYTDSQGMMTQYYVFSPYSTWILDETTLDTGSILKTTPICLGTPNSAKMAMNDFLDVIMRMVSAILTSSTFNYIFSDILRLCGPNDLLTIPLLSEMEAQLPVYDPMKLLQIHNSVAMGAPQNDVYSAGINTPSNDVYPNINTNGLEYYPTLEHGSDTSFILDFPHSDGHPDLDQRVDATRYVGSLTRLEEGKVDFANSTLPDHYVVEYQLWYNRILKMAFSTDDHYNPDSTDNNKFSKLAYVSSCLEKFDYHPAFRLKNDKTGVIYSYTDVDFFTVADNVFLRRFNDLAFQGLFEFRSEKF